MSLVAAADIRCHALLNEIYCERKVGVEIGVYRGDLSWRLLGSNRNIFLYLVDPWEECAPDSSYATTEDHINRCTQAEHDESMRQAMNNVDLFKGQFKVLRMTSEEAAKEFPDEYGVKQAVHEFAKQAGKEFRTGENYTWFVTK